MRVARTMRCLFVAVLFCTSSLVAAAPAKEPPRRLKYVLTPGTENCPGENYLQTAVGAQLGYRPFDDNAPGSLIVTVTRTPKQLEAVIEKQDENGQIVNTPRKLTAPPWRCDQLIDSVAYMISVIYEPVVVQLPQPAPPPAPPAPPAAASSPTPAVPPPAPPSAPAPRKTPLKPLPGQSRSPWVPKLSLSLDGGASLGSAPGVAPSFTFGAGLRWSRFSLVAEGRYEPGGSDHGRSATHVGAAFLPCLQQPLPVLGLIVPACLSMQVDRVTADVNGKTPALLKDVLLGAGLRLGVEKQFLGHFGAHLELDFSHSFSDVVLRLDGTEVWRLADVTFAARVGLDGFFDVF